MSTVQITTKTITAIHEHPKADRLEIAEVAGTQTLVPKGQFKAGQLVIYFPPDICIPDEVAENLGVKNYLRGNRVAAARLRGIPSYGFVVETGYTEENLDCTEQFGGWKYQPQERTILHGERRPEPANFHRYTDIEHYRNYFEFLPEGTPVRVTEKIHGCVVSHTRIRMADGSSKYIRNIKPGDMVAGFQDDKIVPSRVLKVWQNGPTDDWLKIKFPRNRAGRGLSFGAITCTPNHRFLQPDGSYIEASKLSTGDTVAYKLAKLVWQPIVSIEPATPSSKQRWDLETTTHNYLPSSVVTHNSNSRVGLLKVDNEWEFHCGSRTADRKHFDPYGRRSIYWYPLEVPGVVELLNTFCDDKHDVILFGEIFGPKIQDLDYGVPRGKLGYRVFDLSIDGQYVDWFILRDACKELGVPLVPILYEGPHNKGHLEYLTCGPTYVTVETASKFNGREGVVVAPMKETQCPIGRLILKSVSVDYLAR